MLAIVVLCKVGLSLECTIAVWVRTEKVNHGGCESLKKQMRAPHKVEEAGLN